MDLEPLRCDVCRNLEWERMEEVPYGDSERDLRVTLQKLQESETCRICLAITDAILLFINPVEASHVFHVTIILHNNTPVRIRVDEYTESMDRQGLFHDPEFRAGSQSIGPWYHPGFEMFGAKGQLIRSMSRDTTESRVTCRSILDRNTIILRRVRYRAEP